MALCTTAHVGIIKNAVPNQTKANLKEDKAEKEMFYILQR